MRQWQCAKTLCIAHVEAGVELPRWAGSVLELVLNRKNVGCCEYYRI